MLGIGLTPEEVAKRLVRLNNLEQLHGEQKKRIGLLEDQVRLLKEENRILRSQNAAQQKTIDDLKLQMEELRTIVFGKKKKKEDHDDDVPSPLVLHEPRSKESYRRKLPEESEITKIEDHQVDRCVCGTEFTKRETRTYVEEDIPLPQKKTVVKHVIHRGYCPVCGTWQNAMPMPTASVILGPHVRRYVVYLSVICRESYAQIEDILKQTYGFEMSQGEIAKIMAQEGERLRPDYERLKASIRGEPSIHLDETGWDILTHGDRGFAWTMTGGVSHDAVFLLGKTRGKGNAEDLIGDSKAVVVSDDYGAYRNLLNGHQLCCAHIQRKLRDLAVSGEITGQTKMHCRSAYQAFAAIYADIEAARKSVNPTEQYDGLLAQINTVSVSDPRDPAKLSRVKTQVRDRAENYLTCLRHPNVAADNNAAERSLRHLVLKRKISFGSISEKTAETMAILLSVLLSWKRRGELRNYLAGV
jgi:transposase